MTQRRRISTKPMRVFSLQAGHFAIDFRGDRIIAAASTPQSLGRIAPLAARTAQLVSREALDPWFVRTPPIYAVAMAVVAGDALGNCGVFFPLAIACALALFAFALFLGARRSAGVAVALVAIVAAMTVPVRDMLEPAAAPMSLREFPDGTMVSLKGTLVREPEHFPDKTRIYVAAARMSEAVDDPAPV